jgi:glycerophosphoryl diester phosphodiesterase
MAAFAHAVALGVDAVECDVHLSADGEAVLIHDDTLDRTTDATGPVSLRTARELAAVDAGARFGPDRQYPYRGQGGGVPRLAELLDAFPTIPVVIEIKGSDPRTAGRALRVVNDCRAADRVIIGGFSHAVLEYVRREAPGMATSASSQEVQAALRRSWFGLRPRVTGYQVFQVPVRLRGRTVLTARLVSASRRAAIPVQAWIVDEASEMERLLAWGVTGLITDRPDVAVGVVGARS